jgi:hypothetical protein
VGEACATCLRTEPANVQRLATGVVQNRCLTAAGSNVTTTEERGRDVPVTAAAGCGLARPQGGAWRHSHVGPVH